jgi:AhpD family alkylhydroperoxidase
MTSHEPKESTAARERDVATHPSDASHETMFPAPSRALSEKRKQLAPAQLAAFHAFGQSVLADGALATMVKQLIAVAVAHTTQCPYCIRSHTAAALNAGATEEQIMEAIWVAAEMRAGGAYAHSALALDVMAHHRTP